MEFVHRLSENALDSQKMNSWFDDVFDEIRDWILRYIIIHMDCPDQAENAFQEVYSKLFERICRKGLSDIKEPAAFLTKMARRDIGHHRRSQSTGSHVAMIEPDLAEMPSPQENLDDMVVDRSVVAGIRDTVGQMPPLTYKVFALHYFFDMPISAIADELGTSVDAVKSRLSRAHGAVRQKYNQEA